MKIRLCLASASLLLTACGPLDPGEEGPIQSCPLGEIRAAAATLLPGAVITRRLLWRYSLLWTKPHEGRSG